jgi:hypothetical protein
MQRKPEEFGASGEYIFDRLVMFSNPALSGRIEVRASTWASCREKDGCDRVLRDTSQGKEVEKRPGEKPGYPPDSPSIPPLAPAIHTADV